MSRSPATPLPSSVAASAPHETSARVVADHADDGELTAELDRRTEPAAGLIVVHPVPRLTTPDQLCLDLLVAWANPRMPSVRKAAAGARPGTWPASGSMRSGSAISSFSTPRT